MYEKTTREHEQQSEEPQQANRLAEVEDVAESNFLAALSYDMRTPMNVVTGMANLLAKTSLDAQQRKMVETLQINTHLLLKIINDLSVQNAVAMDDSLSNGNRHVLLVEDYAPSVMVATMMLEELGMQVTVAENGAEAIAKFEAEHNGFLAILMDVQMHGMDGLETTRRIRAVEARDGMHNTIIGVTAHALAGDRDRCLAAGMDDYISKPINPDILAARLAQIYQKAV